MRRVSSPARPPPSSGERSTPSSGSAPCSARRSSRSPRRSSPSSSGSRAPRRRRRPVLEGARDARDELAAIRSLMERAREYRHPPAAAGFTAGLAGLAGGLLTHRELAAPAPDLARLGALWGAVFGVAFAGVVVFTSRAARREGKAFWSPLARDVIHALWPSLVAAAALTAALARAGRLELVAPLWLLAYGAGGI